MRAVVGGCAAALAVLGGLLWAPPAVAHHSFTMFEMEKDVTYRGVVTEYHWINPHVHITIEVKPGAGVDPATVGTWDIEGGSTTIMGRQGWTRSTFKPGDPITLVGHPLRNGDKGASLFYAIMPDGKRLYHDIARPKDDAGK